MTSMEFLREVTDEYLKFTLSKLRENLPYAIKDLYFILATERIQRNSKSWTRVSEKLLRTFYTHPNGLKENCTIFAISSKNVDHTVWFFSLEESLSEVKECLVKTKLIKWDKVLFLTVHREQMKAVLDYVTMNGLNIQNIENVAYYLLPKDKALKFDVKIPDGTIIEQLNEVDAKLCNSIWKYRSENSENFVRSLILLNSGFALREKQTKEILAFALINDNLSTGLLTVVEHARGKHYGESMAKLIAKKIARDLDLDPLCFINDLNIPSINLFMKIGYKKIGLCSWITINNKKT